MQSITTCLLFVGEQFGKAEEAINFYVSLFKDSSITLLERYGAGEGAREGAVMFASFSLGGQALFAMDGPGDHAYTFTPAVSLFVRCETEAEIDRLFEALSEGGAVLMELGAYPFSEKYAWVADRFGVTWQLTLARP